MKPPSDEVLAAAQALRVGDGADDLSLPTIVLSIDAGLGPVRLARSTGGHLALLVPTLIGRRLEDGLGGEGLTVRCVQYSTTAGRLQPFVEVECADGALESAFLWLASAVLARLVAGRAPESAVAETVREFRDLIRGARLFPLDKMVGLAGELHVLRRLLRAKPNSVQSWTGPLGQRFDFSLATLCVEVKSSLQRKRSLIHVHGIDQLQPPDDGRPLMLLHLVVEHSGAGGESLSALLADVRRLCSDPTIFDARMQAMGLGHWPVVECFRREHFAVLQEKCYRVDPTFPRLSRESFASGHPVPLISGIEYVIDLAGASACEVGQDEAFSRMVAATP